MTQNREQRCQGGRESQIEAVVPMARGDRKGDRHVPLQGVKDQSHDSEPCATCSGNIRSTDVAAAGESNILPSRDAQENKTKWNRAQKIGNSGDDEVEARAHS